MASTKSKDKQTGSSLFVLALGLLIGFVIGFVVLLSRLPVDGALGEYGIASLDEGLQFYSLLEEQTVQQRPAAPPVVREIEPAPQVIAPATRVVPAEAQSLDPRNLPQQGYAEIPANSIGKESYYLQAGNYRRVEDAEKTRAALMLLDLESFIAVREDSSGAVGYRVRIGPFLDQDRLTRAKQRLRSNNINYKLIRVTG